MPKEYYFISDLHIGGDEALGVCDFEEELIDFIDKIAQRTGDAELIIIGDAFGLWEFTQVESIEKLKTLIGQFPRIFEAFRRVGEKVRIKATLITKTSKHIPYFPEGYRFERENNLKTLLLIPNVAIFDNK